MDSEFFEPKGEHEIDPLRGKRAGTTRERMNTLLMALALLVVIALVAGLFLLITMGGGGPKVPNVVGKTYLEAREKMRSAGFDIEIDSSQDYTDVNDLDGKKVAEQDPKGGTAAEKGDLVTVRLKGLAEVSEAEEGSAAAKNRNETGSSASSTQTAEQNQSAGQQPSAATAAAGRTVCVDPGHSGPGPTSQIDPETGLDVADNSGASGEIQTNWELGQKLKARLEAAGYTVRLTKNSQNENVNLRSRADIGNTCSIVIRLHFDPNLHAVLFPGEGQYKQHGDNVVYVDPAVARGSAELANALFPYLKNAGVTRKANDMGGTSNNTGPAFVGSVLSRVPVVLIENDPAMVKNNPSGQDQVAAAIVSGINSYFQSH